jgi:D-serine deaminase-like pyridoxal phosphate-dependent protein
MALTSAAEAWTAALEPLRALAEGGRASIFDETLPTPLVYVDHGRLDHNLREMADRAAGAGATLRPHVKTHKIAAIARQQLAHGAAGLTVATASEAEAFAAAGVRADYLVSLPFWSAAEVDRVLGADSLQTILSVDSLDLARHLARRCRQRGRRCRVAIVVDTGYHRYGVPPRQAIELVLRCAELPDLAVEGIQSHAGQVYDMPDPEDRRRVSQVEIAQMNEVADGCAMRGLDLRLVSVGSTPAAAELTSLPLGAVNELRPGNYAFLDRQQVALGVAPLERCALQVVTTVVARHGERAVIDAGRMTLSSSHDRDGYGEIVGHPRLRVTSVSQECGIVAPAEGLAVGDRIAIVPVHACEITTLAPLVLHGRGGAVEGAWHVDARACVR